MYKILAIVPYNGLKNKLKNSFKQVSLDFPKANIDLEIKVANLANKKDILNIIKQNHFDIILSRGGTSNFLQQQTNVQTIDIGISQYDIIRTIKTISNLDRTAIICYPAFAHTIKDTLAQFNIKIKIYVVKKRIEINQIMNYLSNQGYKNIICDSGIIADNNRKLFNSYLIESGDERIYQSLKTCFLLLQEKEQHSNYYKLLSEFADLSHDYTLFFSKNDYSKVIFSSAKEKTKFLYPKIRKAIAKKESILHFKGINWHLSIFESKTFTIVALDKLNKIPELKTNSDQEYVPSLYSICYDKHFFNLLNYYSKLKDPISIIGPSGMYKSYLTYLISQTRKQKMIMIKLNKDTLNSLLNSNDSILFNNDQLLVFSYLEELDEISRNRFFNFIEKSYLIQRNKIIFLINHTYGTKLEVNFPAFLQMKEIFLKPLQQMSYNTFNLLVRSIFSHFSLKTGKTFTTISDTALDEISSFSWPNNYRDFIQFMTTVLSISSEPILKGKDVETLLQHFRTIEKIKPSSTKKSQNTLVKPHKTLHELIVQNIKQVLEQNHGNKTKTAKQLNISRATLWRYLK